MKTTNRALNGQELGTVLWYSTRDKNGIIVDENKNELYFDISTWKGRVEPIRGQYVKFTRDRLEEGLLVGKNVADLLG